MGSTMMSIAGKQIALAAAIALWGSAAAHAQWGYPVYHSSTYAEGVQRGFADVVRSAGEYNLNTSEALINVEEARSANLDNHLKYANTYFEMRAVNRQAREAERGPRLSTEQLFRIAQEQAPNRLTSSDLDPLTGDITWPIVLQGNEYNEYRQTLSTLFADRAREGGTVNINELQEIRRTADAALATLRANIKLYPANEYLRARRFLENLSFSATPSAS
jgi:hypothetical protein